MPHNTLPPGWTGNDADHHVTAGPFKIHVGRAATYNPFSRRNERAGGYTWLVRCNGTLATSASLGHPDAAEARKAAVLALRVLVGTAVEMLDWLDAHPVATPTPPAQAGMENE